MAVAKHAPIVDGAVCTFFATSVDIVGTPEALEADDLILREWLPIAPKRRSWHAAHLRDVWDDARSDRDAVAGWVLRRVAGGRGLFCLQLWPRYSREFVGGPTDPTAPRRALARHRALVRARRDASLQAFLATLCQEVAND